MSDGLTVVPETTRDRQRRASDPASSVWVSANAGAGKTKVLTDRVIRLLLDGFAPSRILCLTFTKAAAAEMTIRVFGTLGQWVTAEPAVLTKALLDLTGRRPDAKTLARARRLFARAVETPGGLKIETIHAFCERILHLVPFEAGVTPGFTVLDEDEATELASEIRGTVLTRAAAEGATDLGLASETVGQEASGAAFTELVDAMARNPALPVGPEAIDAAGLDLARAFGLAPGETPESLRRAAIGNGIPAAEWPSIAGRLEATGKKSDGAVASSLRQAAAAADDDERYLLYLPIFFTKAGTVEGYGDPRQSVVTKSVPEDLRVRLAKEGRRLEIVRSQIWAAEALDRTIALYRLAAACRTELQAAKARRGALDFGDLIHRVLELFRRGVGAWVLYKLDRGIDHVLVDEAQDTSPEQWAILRHLTEEFTAGAGATRTRRAVRTIFAVGDPKQSIYSFQGADPQQFEESRRHWRQRHQDADLPFTDVRLDLSFRSARAVLTAVDATFGLASHHRGLSFDDLVVGTSHTSARPRAHGAVEIWPTLLAEKAREVDDAWMAPVDQPDAGSPALRIAARVAEAVRHWTGVPDPHTGRHWRPGDILILARKRGPAFYATIRALKAAGIPVAGADRLNINGQIAVQDLIAAGQAGLLPENDLALACALKSPLVGLDDDDLIRIAADRGGQTLAAALDARAATDPAAARGQAALATWRELAQDGDAFGFYARLLGPGAGRRRLVERLGGEAADAIDVFLNRAAAESRRPQASSLTTFLARFEGADHVVRRDFEAAGDQVKVMTVHGAKGLEAPLVVLLDGCEVADEGERLLPVPVAGRSLPVWAPRKGEDCPPLAAARASSRGRAIEEHNRLLYVALTRARDRLIVAPFASSRGERPESWCSMVRAGFAAAEHALIATSFPHGEADVWTEAGEPVSDDRNSSAGPLHEPAPAWLTELAPVEADPERPLRPSTAVVAADRTLRRPDGFASARREARRRGILVHGLIDHLADRHPADRDRVGAAYLAIRAPRLDAEARREILSAAAGVLSHPDLADLFGPGSRGEVAIAGRIGPFARVINGQIDRVRIAPDRIWLADFKSGRHVPAAAAAYTNQLGLYAEVLAAAYPGRPIEARLVWLDGPTIEVLDEAVLRAHASSVLAAPLS